MRLLFSAIVMFILVVGAMEAKASLGPGGTSTANSNDANLPTEPGQIRTNESESAQGSRGRRGRGGRGKRTQPSHVTETATDTGLSDVEDTRP